MHQQRAQIGIATLADTQQLCLASAGVLSRYQTHPGRKLPSVPKSVAIADGSHNRVASRPDAFHGADTLAFCVLPERPLDTLIGGSNFGF